MSILKKSIKLLPSSSSKYHDILVVFFLLIIFATSSVDYFINNDTFIHSFWLFGLMLLLTIIFYYQDNEENKRLEEKKIIENEILIGGTFTPNKKIPNKKVKRKGKKILHFEDDSFLGAMYKAKFESEGFEVKHFINPPAQSEDLILLVLKEKPDLIIMDIIMPEMSGFIATEILKSDQRTKKIPIFGLDNLNQEEDYQQAIKSGMTDYFLKAHYMPSEIVNMINDFLADPKEYKSQANQSDRIHMR